MNYGILCLMSQLERESVTTELLNVLSPSTVRISDPTIAVEQIRAMNDAVNCGGSAEEVISKYSSRSWELITYYKAIAEGLEERPMLDADEAKMEHIDPLDEIVQILALDGLASVVPAVKKLMHEIAEADAEAERQDEDGDEYATAEGSMIHFYETKDWHAVQYWKAQAEGLDNPFGHKVVTINLKTQEP